VVLVPSRQALPTLDRTKYGAASGVARGGYVLADPPAGQPHVLLIGSGSEVALCLEAAASLALEGVAVRVVSMPSWELFERQAKEYRDSVIPPGLAARVSVEEASTFGWRQYVGIGGATVGMTSFGASAPLQQLQHKFGFTSANVVAAAKRVLAGVAS